MRDGKAKVLTQAEFKRFLAVVDAEPYPQRNKAMAMMLFGLGMRVGELGSMLTNHVVDDDGKLKDEVILLKSNTKTKKSRTLYLKHPKVRAALEEYIAFRLSTGDLYLEAPLFVSRSGQQMDGNTLQQVFARLFKRAGITGAKSHSGRRTFATRLDSVGSDLRSIQELMGHERIEQTADYIDSNPERLRKVAENAI